ncbi:DUF7446 family protein [Nocardioides sp. Leaf285]|uniref:DUF7446 family protein n=1 Tax=Nocardioides sp. Leaf285 TaxID=1736322 RepID=UPI000702476B|nr:hypothetical protein [Nocardioides sp. Leaf285]KQP62998.1 hypothetical protein ASF47_18475 [Nocardioides sp. Leaf285]
MTTEMTADTDTARPTRHPTPASVRSVPRFAVQAAAFSEAIHIGRLTRTGVGFADKEEATDMTLAAVAQYVERNFGGGMDCDFPGLGVRLSVKVEPLSPTQDSPRGDGPR